MCLGAVTSEWRTAATDVKVHALSKFTTQHNRHKEQIPNEKHVDFGTSKLCGKGDCHTTPRLQMLCCYMLFKACITIVYKITYI